MEEKKVLTPQDVAKILQVSKRTVYKVINEQKIPAIQVGKRLRILREDLEKWLQENKIQ